MSKNNALTFQAEIMAAEAEVEILAHQARLRRERQQVEQAYRQYSVGWFQRVWG